MFEHKNASSVSINVELLMYGYVGLNISQTVNGILASWVAIADGGEIISNESKEIHNKNFIDFADNLCLLALPEIESEKATRCWSISILDEQGKQIKGIERGYWDIEHFLTIVTLIDDFFGDLEITEMLHNVAEA